jgi:excisionase family DNA binding protein
MLAAVAHRRAWRAQYEHAQQVTGTGPPRPVPVDGRGGGRGAADEHRFPRRLFAERRIRFVRVGRHVRIPASVLAEVIAAGTVEPSAARLRRRAG